MNLDRLVLQGFKSFADKTTFEFNKNFTAIVGPNGSGKSNISDAIRWVLGEQSLKQLRGKQSQDLIFSGSDKLAKLGMASVELHLNNEDGAFPLDYQEIVISRKLFRNGDSEYRINKSKVRLQDIILMLAKARFGQKSYAVIGQGMITHFLSASPQERKEFFDEATGVKEFQIKRDQAINKLIRTEENLMQGEALMVEIEPHLRSLTRQVKRLERREKIEEQLRDIQVEYYGSLWKELEQEHLSLKEQFETQNRSIKELDNELSSQQLESDAMMAVASRAQRYELLQQQFNEALEKKSYILKEQAVLKGRLEVEHERQGKLSLVWLQRKEDEIVRDIHEYESSHRILEEKINSEENELERQDEKLEGLHNEFREEEYNVLKLKERIEKESQSISVPEIQEVLEELFSNQGEFLQALLQTRSLEEFKVRQQEAQKITEQFAGLMDRLSMGERETVEALRIEMKRKEQLLERLIQDRDNSQHVVNELRVSIETNKAKAEMLHKQIQSLQDDMTEVQSDIDENNATDDNKIKNQQAEQYERELVQYEHEIDVLDKELKALREDIDQFNAEEEEKKSKLVAIQTMMRGVQRKLTSARQEANTIEINLARIETKLEDVRNEVEREVAQELRRAVEKYTGPTTVNRDELMRQIVIFQKQMAAIGDVDKETIQEYDETKERFEFLTEQTTDLSKSIVSLEKIIDELDLTIHNQFQKNFKIINEGFQKYFKVLFNGGKSKLALMTEAEEQEEPEEGSEEAEGESLHDEKKRELVGKKKKRQKSISGIEVVACPPGKKITNVNQLSGGEKSLLAIALLCAIIAHNPSPFIVLDEVEAALDEENSEKFAAILENLAKETQIVIITHNRVTMKAADMLYGVTMSKEGKSHILSVELEEAEELVQ